MKHIALISIFFISLISFGQKEKVDIPQGVVYKYCKPKKYKKAKAYLLKELVENNPSYGLVNEVVPADQLMQCARTWADAIQAGAPLSVQASKEAVNRGLGVPLDNAMQAVYPVARRMYESEDLIEGPRAFAEKRAPRWQGK